MSNESSIIVEKNYQYTRNYVDKNGQVKSYVQNVSRMVSKNDLDKAFNKNLNKILYSTVQLNKLNRIKNSIIRNKCYGKSNFIKQINKIDHGGELTDETRELINNIYKQQYKIANEVEESLKLLLDLYRKEEERILKLNEELRVLDEGQEGETITAN